MEASAQYREFAEKCDRLVEETKDPRHKQVLREMAQAWRNLADEEEERKRPSALHRYRLRGRAHLLGVPHMRHVEEGGLRAFRQGGSCNFQTLLREASVLIRPVHVQSPRRPNK
jgi:hypothetical protein